MQTNSSQKEKRNGYLANTKMERVYLVFYFGFYHIRSAGVIFMLRWTRDTQICDDISRKGGLKIKFHKKSKNQSNKNMNSVLRCTLKTFKLLFIGFMTQNNVKAYKPNESISSYSIRHVLKRKLK